MKKTVILTVLLLYTATNVFAEKIPYMATDAILQNISIKSQGNRINVNVFDDSTRSPQNINKNIVTQNCNGRTDIVNVQNPSIPRATTDPYAVKIDGKKYYMVKDKQDNQYTLNDILGYEDNKSELFNDMKKINSDKDATKITGEELKKAGIRFVAVEKNKLQLYDKSKDYNLDNIRYIDLTTLRGTINKGQIGSFGYFDLYISKNNATKKIIGFVTFDSDETLNKMMSL